MPSSRPALQNREPAASLPIQKTYAAGIRRPQFINPAGLYDPAPNGYTHAVSLPMPQRLVLVSGQGGETADGVLPATFEGQLEQAFDNLGIALASAGSGMADVVKLTVLIVDHSPERLGVLTKQVHQRWPDRPAPACTLIPVPRLALDGMLFEVEAMAIPTTPPAPAG